MTLGWECPQCKWWFRIDGEQPEAWVCMGCEYDNGTAAKTRTAAHRILNMVWPDA